MTGTTFVFGVVFSAVGSVIDNWGMNLQKHSHMSTEEKTQLERGGGLAKSQAKHDVSYTNIRWVTGFLVYLAGQILNFVSLGLIDQPTQSIVSSMALFSNCLFAKHYFNEEIAKKDIIAIGLISVSIWLFVKYFVHTEQEISLEELESHFKSQEFVSFFTVLSIIYALAFSINSCPNTLRCPETYSGLGYAIVAAILGGVAVTFSKIISIIIRGLTTGTITFSTSWFLTGVVIAWVFLLFYSVHALNVGLSNSPAMVMIPTFYTLSNLVAIMLGVVYYEEYQTFESAYASGMCLLSVVLSMIGVYILAVTEAASKHGSADSGGVGMTRINEEEVEPLTTSNIGRA